MTKLFHVQADKRVTWQSVKLCCFETILFTYQHKAVVTELAGPWLRYMAAGKDGLPLNSLLWSFADFCFSCTPFPGTSKDQSA